MLWAAVALGTGALVLTGCVAVQRQSAEAAFAPLGPVVEVAGKRVHFIDEGPRGAPVVVLIHGAGGNLRDFTFDLVGRLEGRYRVIAVDRPGHGYTEAYAGGATPMQQARLFDALADRLKLSRAVVVGHSYGGAVAMAWAVENPARVRGVVSLAGATMPFEGKLDPYYRVTGGAAGAVAVPVMTTLAGDGTIRKALDGIFQPQDPPKGYLDYIGAPLTVRAKTLRANGQQVLKLSEALEAQSKAYPGLTTALEILHGSADTTVGLDIHSRPLSKLVAGANLTVLKGVGHMPQHANPAATVAAIDRAVARAGLR